MGFLPELEYEQTSDDSFHRCTNDIHCRHMCPWEGLTQSEDLGGSSSIVLICEGKSKKVRRSNEECQ